MEKKDLTSLIEFHERLFHNIRDDVNEIAINDDNAVIWAEDNAGWFSMPHDFNQLDLKKYIIALAAYCDDKIDETKPILSAVMPNGDRVQVVISPASKFTSITIRKPSKKHITFEDYKESNFFKQIEKKSDELNDTDKKLCEYLDNNEYVKFIELAVTSHKNIVICGGTGSGKTTFMKSLIDLMDEDERIITIEDVPEITFYKHENYVNLFYPSEAVKGDIITSSTLLKSCMRMKPDRIILAELRGAETFDYLNVIMSGHDGGITSCHASSVKDTFKRLLSMASQHDTASTLGVDNLKSLLESVHVVISIEKSKTIAGLFGDGNDVAGSSNALDSTDNHDLYDKDGNKIIYERRIKEIYFNKYHGVN